LNGAQISINDFPTQALTLCQTANSTAPNRAINILGMARANSQSNNYTEAVRLYNVLRTQMNSSNHSDPIFLQEATNVINDVQNNSFTVMSTVISTNITVMSTVTRTTTTAGSRSLYYHSLLSLLFYLFLFVNINIFFFH
jgi:hypothetical protein